MNSINKYNKLFEKMNCCVIVPTYNNGSTLEELLEMIRQYTSQLLVVNDGSTDNTNDILIKQQNLDIISYPVNRGKGYAIRQGFKKALENGYEYAITIDSDLQHDPADLSDFLEMLENHPGSLIVGARKMQGVNQPRKSGFANKFSNFWFKIETGFSLPDTQSGYRLYPIKQLQNIRFFSKKYEFEVEVLVRAAWKGIPVISIPVHVYYPPESQRVSHFRPLRDFSRISVLNTILVLAAFLYIKPFSFIRYLKRTQVRQFFRENILLTKDSNRKITASVMLGIFMGIVPIWGWQLVSAIALAYILKLNKLIVIVTANISIPPMIPIILYFSYVTGGLILGNSNPISDQKIDFEFIGNNLLQYITGSIVFAAVMAIILGFCTYLFLLVFRKKRILNKAVEA